MPYDQKSRKDKIINHNIAKQAHVNTADPATDHEDAQCMERDSMGVAR